MERFNQFLLILSIAVLRLFTIADEITATKKPFS